jgi:hypothetical protein
MDLNTFTEPYLSFDQKPLRITRIEEDDNCCLKLTLEEFPWSCSAPTRYPAQGHLPTQAGYFAAPGHVNTPMFVQLPESIAQGNPNTIGIALSGSENWGGAAVFVSTDGGDSFEFVGMATGAATMGTLTDVLPVSADPDVAAHDLKVSLTLCSPSGVADLPSYTQAQADSNTSLIAVEGELLSYETADLTGTFQYGLTYLRRGLYGTMNSEHPVNAQFCVLDSGVFQYPYQASEIGKTLYFKFCSVNQAGQQQENISQVTAYPYFVSGPRPAFPWSPGYVSPLPGDALGGPASFGIQPVYGAPDAQGNVPVGPAIYGIPPIVQFSDTVAAPTVSAVVGSAGTLSPGTYVVGASAFDAATPIRNTDLSNLCTMVVPAGPSTGSIALTVTWGTGSNGGDIYMAGPVGTGGFHRQAGIGVGVTTAVITAFDMSTEGGPDQMASVFSVKWCKIIHGGPWAQQIQSVTSNTITIADPLGNATTNPANTWAGYVLSLWAKANPSNPADLSYEVPILNMPILSSTATVGGLFTLTIGPNAASVQLQDLTASPLYLSKGDVVVVRSNPTFTASSYTDPNIANTYYPGGMSGIEVGHWAVVMTGPDAGDVQTVTSVSGINDTTINVTPWKVLPNPGDLVLIVDPNYAPEVVTQPISASNKTPTNGVIAQPTIENLTGGAWLFTVSVEDANGESAENSPTRELYFAGAQGTRVVTS